MKIRIIVILIALSLFSTLCRAQWVQTNGPYGEVGIQSLDTIDTILIAGSADGVSLSTDDGTSWALSDGSSNGVDAFAVIGTKLFAASNGPYGSGILFSSSDGSFWTSVGNGLPNTNVYACAVIDSDVFAGTFHDGAFLSTNNGAIWTAVDSGLPNSCTVITFATSGTNLFVGTDAGIFLSTNFGTSWVADNTGLTSLNVNALATMSSYLFAATDGGIFRSSDYGTSWEAMNMGLTDSVDVSAFAVSGANLFVGTIDSGVFLSTNNGLSWIAESSGLKGQSILSLAVSGANLFAGTVGGFVWRRPLSEMINTSAVETASIVQQSITAYPNPFSQSSTITFSCAESGAGEVTIVNLLGAEVARIFSGELDAGDHSFAWDASGFALGIYECIVRVNGNVQRIPLAHY